MSKNRKKVLKEDTQPLPTVGQAGVKAPVNTNPDAPVSSAVVDQRGKVVQGRLAADKDLENASGANTIDSLGRIVTNGKKVTWQDLRRTNASAVVDANGNVIIGRTPTADEMKQKIQTEKLDRLIRKRVEKIIQENFWNMYKTFNESLTQNLNLDGLKQVSSSFQHPFCTAARSFLQHLEQGQIALHITNWTKKMNGLDGMKVYDYRDLMQDFLIENADSLWKFKIENAHLIATAKFNGGEPRMYYVAQLYYKEDGYLSHVSMNIDTSKVKDEDVADVSGKLIDRNIKLNEI